MSDDRATPAPVTAPAPGNRKKVSVGGIARDAHGRVLLVNPTYKARWDLPGGILEHGEDPVSGLLREVAEELGTTCRVGALAAVDYGPSDWEGAEIIMLTFHVELGAQDVTELVFGDGEISEAAFHAPEDALELVTPRMADRLRVALDLKQDGAHGIFVDRTPPPDGP
ncbi:NUDIX hydrolase [Streptomyces sp. NPDC091267]|uniref:NUDIX hydrolase n=1 Tax=Streptomyces sp. NPDC091267 TaxID=3155195 RepID=UPI003413EC65